MRFVLILTMNIEDNPPADGGGHIILGDAEEGPHLVPPDVHQVHCLPLPLPNSCVRKY